MVEDKITGLMVYYYIVCKRKLWYSHNEINMETESEDVAMGKFLDERTYGKEKKHSMINNEINLDFVEKDKKIHEIKKSRKIEEASIWQLKYYIFYLENRGVKDVKGEINYPLLKKTVAVELTPEDRITIEEILIDIRKIILLDLPPRRTEKKICKKCAFMDFCFI